MTWTVCLCLALCLAMPQLPATATTGDLADVTYGTTSLQLDPLTSADHWTLTLVDPAGAVSETVSTSTPIVVQFPTGSPDGSWTWELRRIPKVDPAVQAQLQAARGTSQEQQVYASLAAQNLLPTGPFVQSGSLTVVSGQVIDPTGPLEKAEPAAAPSLAAASDTPGFVTKDILHHDDVIVRPSLCVGFDCADGEDFGFDTVRLEEHNVQIHFDDTSDSSYFPDNDWRLIANDPANGGADQFVLEDSTAGEPVVVVRAGSRRHSLSIQSSGRVGLGTGTPTLDLHVVGGNSPSLRLDQDGSAGFQPQIWDIVGNETNFFVRDSSNGGTLPLRIFPGNDHDLLNLRNDQVGVGTSAPAELLHVWGRDQEAKLLVEEDSPLADGRQLLELRNHGNVNFILVNTAEGGENWQLIADTGGAHPGFSLSRQGSGQREFRIAPNGDVYAAGALVHMSSRAVKEGFEELDPRTVLERVSALPVGTWSYSKDDGRIRHAGPMAEDFHRAFGLGASPEHIAVSDSVGIAYVALQGLHREVEERDAAKDQRIAELEAKVSRLETLLTERVESSEDP